VRTTNTQRSAAGRLIADASASEAADVVRKSRRVSIAAASPVAVGVTTSYETARPAAGAFLDRKARRGIGLEAPARRPIRFTFHFVS
jgi:hypothetical protein